MHGFQLSCENEFFYSLKENNKFAVFRKKKRYITFNETVFPNMPLIIWMKKYAYN